MACLQRGQAFSTLIPPLYAAPEWQKEAYLYPILKGTSSTTSNISEPGAGSDAAAIQATAVRDRDNYIINGIKRWAPPPTRRNICFATP